MTPLSHWGDVLAPSLALDRQAEAEADRSLGWGAAVTPSPRRTGAADAHTEPGLFTARLRLRLTSLRLSRRVLGYDTLGYATPG